MEGDGVLMDRMGMKAVKRNDLQEVKRPQSQAIDLRL